MVIIIILRTNKLETKVIRFYIFSGLVSLRTLDLSHNFIEKIDNKTHGLLDDCLSLERVSTYLMTSNYNINDVFTIHKQIEDFLISKTIVLIFFLRIKMFIHKDLIRKYELFL